MDNIKNLLLAKELEEYIKVNDNVSKEKDKNAYNVFTISSQNTQYENFHSDIIGDLLSPNGKHGLGNIFLLEFIRFLNCHYGTAITAQDFSEAEVLRESGNIDILIKTAEKAIIIENKMNFANDMEEQLARYYQKCKEDYKLSVEAIIYLSLDGSQTAPKFGEIDKIVCDIAAFNDKPNDLVSAWLRPCKGYCSHLGQLSFLHEYTKLIQHLAQNRMGTENESKLYDFLAEDNRMSSAKELVDFYNKIPVYRLDRLQERLKDNHQPFNKLKRWQPNQLALIKCSKNGLNYEIYIFTTHEGATIFLECKGDEEMVKKEFPEKIKKMGISEKDYKIDNYSRYVFNFGGALKKIDEEIFDFLCKIRDNIKS